MPARQRELLCRFPWSLACLVGVLPELGPLVPQRLRPHRELLHAGVGGGQPARDGGAAVFEPGHAALQALQAVPQALEALLEARAQVVVLVGERQAGRQAGRPWRVC